jgi:xylitol oxidase
LFNTIADSKDQFLSIDKFDPNIVLDKSAGTVTVAAGIRYGQLAEGCITKDGRFTTCLTATYFCCRGLCYGTHGSGIKNGNLSTAVRAGVCDGFGRTIKLSQKTSTFMAL